MKFRSCSCGFFTNLHQGGVSLTWRLWSWSLLHLLIVRLTWRGQSMIPIWNHCHRSAFSSGLKSLSEELGPVLNGQRLGPVLKSLRMGPVLKSLRLGPVWMVRVRGQRGPWGTGISVWSFALASDPTQSEKNGDAGLTKIVVVIDDSLLLLAKMVDIMVVLK